MAEDEEERDVPVVRDPATEAELTWRNLVHYFGYEKRDARWASTGRPLGVCVPPGSLVGATRTRAPVTCLRCLCWHHTYSKINGWEHYDFVAVTGA